MILQSQSKTFSVFMLLFCLLFSTLIMGTQTVSTRSNGRNSDANDVDVDNLLDEKDSDMLISDNGQKLQDEEELNSEELHPQNHQNQSHYHHPSEAQFWWNSLLSLVLIVTGAFCSGLTVGLCNIDTLQLQVMTMSKQPAQQKLARQILDVVGNHHLFLVTLLVYNAIALESLPLVVHTLMPDWAAILFSTIAVLIVAEIVPQSVCTGPKKMTLAYYAAPVIKIMTKVLFFVIYPMAKGLDWLLGTHDHHRIQHKDFANFLTGNKMLKQTEKVLLTSTLELRTEKVEQRMIPLKKIYMIEMTQPLTETKCQEIYRKDFSYILVYKQKRENILGVIKVKEFSMKYLKGNNKTLRAEQVLDQTTNFLSVYRDTNLLEMLMLFQAKSSRIALISDEKKKTDSSIPSIMYTKTDMLMKKKGANIIGAIFLYTIFDEIVDYEAAVATGHVQHGQGKAAGHKSGEEREMKELNKPLLD